MLPAFPSSPRYAESGRHAVPDAIRRMVEEILIRSPVAVTLGIALESVAVDQVELVLPFSPANITVGDVVHGGVIATLIDVAGAAAAISGAEPDSLRGGATGSLTVHFLAPAQAATLRAVATVVRRGKRQVVTDVCVYAEGPDDSTLVAKALMTSSLF